MVYCDGVEVDSKLGRLIQAFRCDRPSEWQMDEFIQMAEDMHKEITRLRETEKDAAMYRWLRDIARHEYDVDDFFGGSSDSVDGMIDKAMRRMAMSEKMRDDFFEWYYQQEPFIDAHREELWKAWQASRAALVVELPDEYKDRYLDKYQEGFNDAVESCSNRLEDLGIELE